MCYTYLIFGGDVSMEFFLKINWVDIFIALIVLRCFVVGVRRGFVVEIFKCLGTVAAIFTSFQYYLKLADLLKGYLPVKPHIVENISFVILAITSYLVFVLLRSLFLLIFKFEATSVIEKIVGFIFGFLRGILLTSLMLVFFVMLNNTYISKSIDKSRIGNNVLVVAHRAYSFISINIFKNILTKEEVK